jgi:stage V sporulation protein G
MKFKAEIKNVFEDKDKLKAVASVVLDDCFLIKNVRIVDGAKGLFISMPSRRNVNGEFTELCFPLSAELRHELSDTVLQAYKEALEAPVESENEK